MAYNENTLRQHLREAIQHYHKQFEQNHVSGTYAALATISQISDIMRDEFFEFLDARDNAITKFYISADSCCDDQVMYEQLGLSLVGRSDERDCNVYSFGRHLNQDEIDAMRSKIAGFLYKGYIDTN